MSKQPSTPHGEASTLDMTKPDDCLRWALGALELVENGLRNRRKLQDDDVEMSNLRAVKTSIEKARAALSESRGAIQVPRATLEKWKEAIAPYWFTGTEDGDYNNGGVIETSDEIERFLK